jgi:GT2 family glycosyltransferase
VGLFDERFFAYYEDLDFCLRARQAGFRIATAPNARLWHTVASTTGLGTQRREYLMARSSVVFYARHAAWRLPFVVAARTGSLLKTLAVHARRSRPDLIRAHLSGLRDGLHDVFDKSPAR